MSEASHGRRSEADSAERTISGLRVAFISPGAERTAGSGATYYMAQQLRRFLGGLVEVPSPNPAPSLVRRVLWNVSSRLTGHAVRWKSTKAYAVTSARHLERQLADCEPDLVFSALASWDLAMLRVSVPIVSCTDSTFHLVAQMGGYPLVARMSQRSLERATRLERDMARRCALHLVPTRWVAQSLCHDYSVPAEKIFVVPWGANLDPSEIPPASEVIRSTPGETCRLLLVGVDWQRKGGEIAIETLERLIDLGIPAELIAVGCEPPPEHRHGRLTVVGPLNKDRPEDRRTLMHHFMGSDFLLLPTRADTFGHVFGEAGALGLPSITTRVGGVGEVVRDGENGYALPFAATGADYAELIAAVWRDKDRYHGLSRGSRSAFDQRLNWEAWGKGVEQAIVTWMAERPVSER